MKEVEEQDVQLAFEKEWLHKPGSGVSNVLYSWPADIRAETDPTAAQVRACAMKCKDSDGCASFVIRHDTATPNTGDSVCGLILQKYDPASVVGSTNTSTYERKTTPST